LFVVVDLLPLSQPAAAINATAMTAAVRIRTVDLTVNPFDC
jgi:hypothetical protein